MYICVPSSMLRKSTQQRKLSLLYGMHQINRHNTNNSLSVHSSHDQQRSNEQSQLANSSERTKQNVDSRRPVSLPDSRALLVEEQFYEHCSDYTASSRKSWNYTSGCVEPATSNWENRIMLYSVKLPIRRQEKNSYSRPHPWHHRLARRSLNRQLTDGAGRSRSYYCQMWFRHPHHANIAASWTQYLLRNSILHCQFPAEEGTNKNITSRPTLYTIGHTATTNVV